MGKVEWWAFRGGVIADGEGFELLDVPFLTGARLTLGVGVVVWDRKSQRG